MERRQEADGNRAKIARVIARYSAANLAEMRSNSISPAAIARAKASLARREAAQKAKLAAGYKRAPAKNR